ncbi:MAG: sulfatase [Deltaproteobacteria bacterium]|nr:sulfatase [Deltaproteobacteria bacterium]
MRQWLLAGGSAPAAEVTLLTVGDETRPGVRLAPGATVAWPVAVSGRLHFAFAAERAEAAEHPPRLEVNATEAGGGAARLATVAAASHRHWQTMATGQVLRAGQRISFTVPQSEPSAVLLGDPWIEPPAALAPALVVVVLIDTLRADHTSLLGYHLPTTPNLEQLARDGVTFTQAHTPAPWTRPSVTSLLTSLDPLTHRVVDRVDRLPQQITTWPEVIRRQGFRTAAVSTNPNVLPLWGLAQGFGRFIDLDSFRWLENSDAQQVFARAERLLDDEPLPLFLYLHVNDPHGPYDPPPPAARQLFPDYSPQSPGRNLRATDPPAVIAAAVRRYDGEIRHADAALGQFIERLRARGLYDNAAIAVVGDHGEEFTDHGDISHGKTLFEEMLHVPLLIKFPKAAHRGERVARMSSLTDVLPTLAAAMGWPSPPAIAGQDLMPAMAGKAAGRSRLTASTQLDGTLAYGLMTAEHKLIRRLRPHNDTLLFDLQADPQEHRPSADQARRDELQRMLDAELARGRSGWHVRICGGAGAQAISVAVDGVEGAVESTDLEAEDRLEAAAGSGRLRLEATVGPVTRQRELLGKLVDTATRDADELWFAGTRPTLRVSSRPEQERPSLRLGHDSPAAVAGAIELEAARLTVAAGEAPECSAFPGAMILVWYIARPPEAETARPDAATRERLRALGYAVE